MKVNRGTKLNGTIPCRWTENKISYQWELEDWVNGLCSKYAGDSCDDLPEKLSLTALTEIVKEQFTYHGTCSIWAWSDDMLTDEAEELRAWGSRVVLRVLPDLEVPT